MFYRVSGTDALKSIFHPATRKHLSEISGSVDCAVHPGVMGSGLQSSFHMIFRIAIFL
jgi:hypothetical protein